MIRRYSWPFAASPLFLAASTSYGSAVLFLIVLSVSEAFWSPRTNDYLMRVAPDGREGVFAAVAAAPLALAVRRVLFPFFHVFITSRSLVFARSRCPSAPSAAR